MSATDLSRKVWCFHGDGDDPHGIILELNDEDTRRWYEAREKEDRQGLGRFDHGKPVVVTDQASGEKYLLRSAPCGEGCRCAAQAIPLDIVDGKIFVGADCTLDDKPATIAGLRLDFGWVCQVPNGLRVEYAWPTIARVMFNGGRFRS